MWFGSAADLAEGASAFFTDAAAPLRNPDHAHLHSASIGFLWTNVSNAKKGRMVIGTAEPGAPQGAMGKWGRAKATLQVTDWFGIVPDFIITLDANWWLQASDAEAYALIEHELYHRAQDRDEYGAPKFNRQTGRPVFTMRGYDIEEFIGVVRHYGADAAGIRALIEAAEAEPEIAAVGIAQCCGTCRGAT
ncbi:putative metallopeptidase [Paracoccus sp. 08]|uniref:putative metallopeptidase n=1 Tax=Paracoccus sp. 08 TaxID=2606624 RepID=UPI0020953DF7|nr:putative metallopeptidase [Paracoccus sp. 08]MCO6363104.1 hypothetical protein [Paracoccus sp. 08]